MVGRTFTVTEEELEQLMKEVIFESLLSFREANPGAEPIMGLGLTIALIIDAGLMDLRKKLNQRYEQKLSESLARIQHSHQKEVIMQFKVSGKGSIPSDADFEHVMPLEECRWYYTDWVSQAIDMLLGAYSIDEEEPIQSVAFTIFNRKTGEGTFTITVTKEDS